MLYMMALLVWQFIYGIKWLFRKIKLCLINRQHIHGFNKQHTFDFVITLINMKMRVRVLGGKLYISVRKNTKIQKRKNM